MKTMLERATERTNEILEQLDMYGFDVEDPYKHELPDGFYVDDGACRVVVIDSVHKDFVIKFGWNKKDKKYCEREEEVYEAAEEKGLGQYFAWTHYICDYQNRAVYAMEYLDCDEETISDKSSDYCWELFCEDNGIDTEDEDGYDYDVRDDFWDSYNDSTDHTYGVLRYLYSLISAKDAVALDQFVWDWDINDLHDGNWGLRGANLVMCDYAGYGW